MKSVTKQFTFAYGHRVLGHQGKCKYLHGHTGMAEVTISSKKLDELGMVVDFGIMKDLIGKWIDENWDHNMLLSIDDPLWSGSIINSEGVFNRIFAGRQPFLFNVNPTAENMAQVLFRQVILDLPGNLNLDKVRIYETPTSWSDYDGKED